MSQPNTDDTPAIGRSTREMYEMQRELINRHRYRVAEHVVIGPDNRMVALATSGEDAERIVNALNEA